MADRPRGDDEMGAAHGCHGFRQLALPRGLFSRAPGDTTRNSPAYFASTLSFGKPVVCWMVLPEYVADLCLSLSELSSSLILTSVWKVFSISVVTVLATFELTYFSMLDV